MIGYVYLTKNLVNNKMYIGQHCATTFDTNYYGSGKLLKQAMKKYGKQNFSVEILVCCDTQAELDEMERYYIHLFSACENTNFYNIALGGKMCQLLYQTEETKQKISRANTGKKRSDECNRKNSELRKNFKWMHKEGVQTTVFESEINAFLQDGWEFGMLPGRQMINKNPETAQKISDALIGKTHSLEHIEHHRKALKDKHSHWYTDGVTNILLSENEEIPIGFYLGRVCSEQSKEKNRQSHKGKIPWNKGKKLKQDKN